MNRSPACIMCIQTLCARPFSLRNVATSAALISDPISCANCRTWARVISAVTFSRQHFFLFLRSIISASRQNGFACRDRNISGAHEALCEESPRCVTLLTISRDGGLRGSPQGTRGLTALCYPASINDISRAHLCRNGGMVLQGLGRNRVPGTTQEVTAFGRIHGAVLRHAGDQHIVL